ncbi:glycosyltransferase [Candidatus Bathyarchaeota archaeon]|nr:MAG: glycosyltransferase [Candidatus Bathyarchaeota archaeon]
MIEKLVCDSNAKRIGYFSTYPPRECGIANYTKDLIDAISELGELKPSIIAINEKGAIYSYDRRVKFVIDRDNAQDYIKAAEYVNSSNIQLLVIQHEFGLYGGDYGEYIKFFLENVKKPIITTLHTVQPNFDKKAIEVLKYITRKSEVIIVIAHAAINMLKQQGIACKKYVVIPHGCPSIEFTSGDSAKEALCLKDRLVTSTFGLISSGKGIEYAIQALPEVIKKEPRIIYLIIGETHPEVRKHEGEKYRNELTRLVNELGLEKHVRFTNRFLTKRELSKYLQATDIYLTPYISPNQISSGTLIYALGAGKAVVSTPYYHAQEVLANDRGLLCKFQDSASITAGINRLLDESLRKEIQNRAYKYSRRFLWKNVAKKYINLIKAVTENNE